MINVMVDLETLGTGPNSVIVSIGAVIFFPETNKLGKEFYQVVDIASCVDAGLKIDPNTVLWWMTQTEEAREVFKQSPVRLPEALEEFSRFLPKDTLLWGNGSDFDNVILANAYMHCSKGLPWKFYNNRCYRTAKNLFEENLKMRAPSFKRVGIYHNALDDAKTQATYLMKLLNAA